jgi:thiamine-phosphate pyrophosphorylase
MNRPAEVRLAPGRLHVLTDMTLQGRFDHVELARLAALGGADAIQYRDKRDVVSSERVRTARALRDVSARAALIVNDHVDVALAVGADGVHLGRNDAPVDVARATLGEGAWIGATANSLEEALRIDGAAVDYLGVGPVFGTGSKSNPAPALGLERLRRIVRAVRVPVIAIGNITEDRVAAVLQSGAHGIAVLSAVACAEDPQAATWSFRQAIDRFVGERLAVPTAASAEGGDR